MRASDGSGQRGHIAPRHVWIDGLGLSAARAPGILLDWRTSGGRWDAYCVWADGGGNVKPRAYFEWLPEDRVSPRSESLAVSPPPSKGVSQPAPRVSACVIHSVDMRE